MSMGLFQRLKYCIIHCLLGFLDQFVYIFSAPCLSSRLPAMPSGPHHTARFTRVSASLPLNCIFSCISSRFPCRNSHQFLIHRIISKAPVSESLVLLSGGTSFKISSSSDQLLLDNNTPATTTSQISIQYSRFLDLLIAKQIRIWAQQQKGDYAPALSTQLIPQQSNERPTQHENKATYF